MEKTNVRLSLENPTLVQKVWSVVGFFLGKPIIQTEYFPFLVVMDFIADSNVESGGFLDKICVQSVRSLLMVCNEK